jgi:DNA-binding NarL/FixJ family response regulator
MIKILIVAECRLAAEAIRRTVRHVPRCQVIGYVDSRQPCPPELGGLKPDVIVVDDVQVRARVIDRIREARQLAPQAKIVLLADDMGADWLDEAAQAGTAAAIAKSTDAAAVGMLIREVAAGNVYHAFMPRRAPRAEATPLADMLTRRELEILRYVTAGMSNGLIARELWVTEQTVKFHLSNIYRKLGVRNRTEASHYAHVNGFLGAVAQEPVMVAA